MPEKNGFDGGGRRGFVVAFLSPLLLCYTSNLYLPTLITICLRLKRVI